MLLRLIPNVFYRTLDEGLDLFVGGLGFRVLHRNETLAILGRDGIKVSVVANAVLAATDRPELALETDSIADECRAIGARRPDLLHPNLPAVTARPWGALEFALLDKTGVCVIVRQWPESPPP